MTKKDIEAILINRFGIYSAVQVLPKDRDEVLYLIEAVPVSNEMSVGEVQKLCEDIATALGGYLYGTISLDCTVPGKMTVEMMVEVFLDEILFETGEKDAITIADKS